MNVTSPLSGSVIPSAGPTVSEQLDQIVKAYPSFAARTDKSALFALSVLSFELGTKKPYPFFKASDLLRSTTGTTLSDVAVPHENFEYKHGDVRAVLANCFSDNPAVTQWEDIYDGETKNQLLFHALLFETPLFEKLRIARFITQMEVEQFRKRATETLDNYYAS